MNESGVMVPALRTLWCLPVVLTVVSACGRADGDEGGNPGATSSTSTDGSGSTATATSTQTTTSTSTSTSTSTGSSTSTSSSTTNSGFCWALQGPADPDDPPDSSWYAVMQEAGNGNCSRLRSEVPGQGSGGPPPALWRALAAVCAAAVEGDESQWTTAEEEATGVHASGCLERAALDLLERALAWHQENPDRTPRVTVPGKAATTACFEITGVSNADGTGDGAELQGSVDGGTPLIIAGRGIEDPDQVLIGGRPAVIGSSGPEGASVIEVEVMTPSATAPGAARIELWKNGRGAIAEETFLYTDASGSNGASSSSTSASSASSEGGEPSTSSQPGDSGAPSVSGAPSPGSGG